MATPTSAYLKGKGRVRILSIDKRTVVVLTTRDERVVVDRSRLVFTRGGSK